jgi:hypothetical protein
MFTHVNDERNNMSWISSAPRRSVPYPQAAAAGEKQEWGGPEIAVSRQQSTDDFVEIPKWVRLCTNAWWSTGPRPSRRQAHLAEALCMGCCMVFLAASWPETQMSWRGWRPVRTPRGTVIDYTFVLALLIVFFGLVFLAVRGMIRVSSNTDGELADDHHRRMSLPGGALHRIRRRYCN